MGYNENIPYNKLMGNETWRWIPSYKGRYKISDFGHVMSFVQNPAGHLLTPRPVKGGYLTVRLGGTRYWFMHRLVLWAFDRAPEPGEQCRHLDGYANNNCIDNLLWGSAKQNSFDKRFHGTHMCGEDMFTAKLTEEQVLEIRHLIKDANGTISQQAVADKYGVGPGAVSAIARGTAWTHVGGPDCSNVPRHLAGPEAACSTETAQEILNWYIKDKTQQQLANRYNVSRSTISYIINRNGTYADLDGPEIKRHHRKAGPVATTHEEAVAIREEYGADHSNSALSLGNKYGISNATVAHIVNATGRWAHFGSAVSQPPLVDPELAQKVHDEYYSDARPTQRELVARYGLHETAVNNIVRRKDAFEYLTPPAGNKTSRYIEKPEAKEIRQQYMDPTLGHTLESLSKLHRSSIGTINGVVLATGRYKYFGSRLKKKTVGSRPPRFTPEQAQEILDLYSSKQYTRQELATKFNCSTGVVANVVHRKGPYSTLELPNA